VADKTAFHFVRLANFYSKPVKPLKCIYVKCVFNLQLLMKTCLCNSNLEWIFHVAPLHINTGCFANVGYWLWGTECRGHRLITIPQRSLLV